MLMLIDVTYPEYPPTELATSFGYIARFFGKIEQTDLVINDSFVTMDYEGYLFLWYQWNGCRNHHQNR
jgi:hypothetical protein